jgi:hypothetical protein
MLGTPISSFPQTYLGLPLSPTKLPPSSYQPLIDRIDIYIAGWRASLLSKGGRLVLLSAVLDNQPTYFMSSIMLPMLILQLIDKRRRTFFWSDDDNCTALRAAELSSLLALLQDFQVTNDADVRTMIDCAPFSSRAAYKQLHVHLSNDDFTPI